MTATRNPRLLVLGMAAFVVAACSGQSLSTAATTTTGPGATTFTTVTTATSTTVGTTTAATSPANPEPAFVPPACADAPVTTVAPGELPTTTVPPAALTVDQQTAVLTAVDAAVRDHFLYPDFNGADWDGSLSVLTADITNGLDTPTFYQRVGELITSLGDEHSHLETPAQVAAAEAQLAGTAEYVGIGVMALPVPGAELVTILAVFPDSAADHAGLELHDSILAIDGVPLGDEPGTTGLRIRGPECSLVTMMVRTPGDEERLVSAVRFPVEGGIPIDARLVPTEDARAIGYIMIPTLLDGTADDQVKTALEQWGPLDGLIVDLRMNGGGSSGVLEPLLGLFTSGTVGDFVSRDGTRPLDIADGGVANSQTVPLVILVGEDTVSYAEVMAGTLRAVGRATLIGETTKGNVETLDGYGMPDGSRLWLASESFHPRADPEADWEGSGILPDITVPADWWDFTFATDPALPPALQALAGG